MVTYIQAAFGNPLNKIKKNEWVENIGISNSPPGQRPFYRHISDQFHRGKLSPMESVNGSLRKLGREVQDEELYNHGRKYRDNLINDMTAIKHKDYTDIRYDPDSGQNVGFPKVNGYMEVPLPSASIYDADYDLNNYGRYVYKKQGAMTPERASRPRGQRDYTNTIERLNSD